ncbi:MAG TPA: hypothetical protein VFI37_05580 [Gaiellaceae bacterium]|nr:hypothetical protein [Gaiellaceae bacterium]
MGCAFGASALAALCLAGAAQAGTIRVAVPSLADPEVAWNLERHGDELCGPPRRLGPRRYRLDCDSAASVARALAPYGVARVSGRRVEFRAAFAWRRFPLFLRNLAVPGTRRFSTVTAGPARIVAVRPGLRLEFLRLEPHAAAAAFARGAGDVAPVPAGDLHAALVSPGLRGKVRVRQLDAVDLVRFDSPRSALADLPSTRRTYWLTADRLDYALLVSDGVGPPAAGLLRDAPAPTQRELRDARGRIGSLPPVRVRIAGDQALASIAVADWRDRGLGPVTARSSPDRFERLTALYPGPEGLFLALDPSPGPLLREALAARDPLPALRRLDARLRARALVVSLARRVGARLVSARLRGWRQDALGRADYLHVRVG